MHQGFDMRIHTIIVIIPGQGRLILAHSAVLRLWRLELTLQSLSPVLVLYDPFGVDVPLNCDTTTTTTIYKFPFAQCMSFERS